MHWSVMVLGFLLCMSLIVAIGLQNLFVIRQGLLNQRPYVTAGLCAGFDALVIVCGIFALSWANHYFTHLAYYLTYIGLAFLLGYGSLSIVQAFKSSPTLESGENTQDLKRLFWIAAAFSLLNPQAYIDAFIILGARASHYTQWQDIWLFTLGAVSASIIWFFSLAHTARMGSRWFRSAMAWRLLAIISGLTMYYCAYLLYNLPV